MDKVEKDSLVEAVALLLHFGRTWDGLARMGVCDEKGGAEFERVLKEWVEADRPSNIEEFIAARASATLRSNLGWRERGGA
jgi:hypothetical protein